MQPTADLSILTLVANASLVVKCVLAILVFLSRASWTVIVQIGVITVIVSSTADVLAD